MISDNRTEVRKVLIITLLLNLFVMGLKAIVGSWTGSLSLLAVDQMAIAPEVIHAIATSVPGVINCHNIASRGVLGR